LEQEGVIEKTGPFARNRVQRHLLTAGSLARATGQTATNAGREPEGAYEMIDGRFTEEQRNEVASPESWSQRGPSRKTSRRLDRAQPVPDREARAVAVFSAPGTGIPTEMSW
jgi:hypothetical protein